MRILRNIYLWIYCQIVGRFPVGTLVRFNPPLDLQMIRDSHEDPEYGQVGVVVGMWCLDRDPGYFIHGSVVLAGNRTFDLPNWSLEAI